MTRSLWGSRRTFATFCFGSASSRKLAPATRARKALCQSIECASRMRASWRHSASWLGSKAGREPVYDLVMPRTHNFLAGGLIVHNSGELEQTSDIVLFLYREDYYDPEKAQRENKENVCEIIIAKHRNGPIGTIELYFHKEFSRFENLSKRR